MRALSVLLLSLAAGPAWAGDLIVRLDRPVLVYVDGRLVAPDAGGLKVSVADIGAGDHMVEIRNMLGATVTSQDVPVGQHEKVTLNYARKKLTEVGREDVSKVKAAQDAAAEANARAAAAEREAELARREAELARREAALANQQAGATQAAPSQAASSQAAPAQGGTTESVTATAGPLSIGITITESGGGAAVSAGTSVSVGATGTGGGTGGPNVSSASFVGPTPDMFALYLDGKEVPYVASWGAFVVSDLPPGRYPFRMTMAGSEVFSAGFTTEPGRHSACTVLPEPMNVRADCVDGGQAYTKADLRGGAVGTGGASISMGMTGGGAAAAPAAPAAPQPVSEPELQRLIQAVEDASFSDDQVDVLRTAAAHNHFTCAQVARLLAPISFSDPKVEAVKALRPAIVDPGKAYEIESAFDFSTDKEKVRALFR